MKGVSYCFFTYNVIEQNGEEWVRESFDSIKGQSDDIMVVDYSSDDNIEEIAEEYNFRFFTVDKVKDLSLHNAKLFNKGVYESKYDLFVPISSDCIYDEDLTNFILEWYENYGHDKYYLIIYYLKQNSRKILEGLYGFSGVFYKPLLLKIRGCDERTYVRGGTNKGAHRYTCRIMLEVYGLKPFSTWLKNFHRFHPKRINTDSTVINSDFRSGVFIESFKENFNENVKNVVNSYW